MSEVKIDPEFEKLIPPLETEEYRQLEENIMKDGCREALTVWNGVLVDGHNRYRICTEHHIKFQTENMDFPNREAVIEWILRNQLGRRNLSGFQKAELVLRLKPIIQEKAKEKQLSTQNNDSGRAVFQKSGKQESPTHTDKELAKLAGVSHDTIYKAEIIKNEGTEEQIQRARQGGKGNSVNAIVNEIKQKDGFKKCTVCGEVKPMMDFRYGHNVCRDCTNIQNADRRCKNYRGESVKIDPKTQELFKQHSRDIYERMYDPSQIPEYTVENLEEEIKSLSDYLQRNVDQCLEDHKNLVTAENKPKIIAALSSAEATIKKIKELCDGRKGEKRTDSRNSYVFNIKKWIFPYIS